MFEDITSMLRTGTVRPTKPSLHRGPRQSDTHGETRSTGGQPAWTLTSAPEPVVRRVGR